MGKRKSKMGEFWVDLLSIKEKQNRKEKKPNFVKA